jgi:hypothetical protein
VEFLLVNAEGSVLAVLESIEEVARELERIGRDPHASGRIRVVRHDEHGGAVIGVSSFVTASPLPSPQVPRRQPPKPPKRLMPKRGLRLH